MYFVGTLVVCVCALACLRWNRQIPRIKGMVSAGLLHGLKGGQGERQDEIQEKIKSISKGWKGEKHVWEENSGKKAGERTSVLGVMSLVSGPEDHLSPSSTAACAPEVYALRKTSACFASYSSGEGTMQLPSPLSLLSRGYILVGRHGSIECAPQPQTP